MGFKYSIIRISFKTLNFPRIRYCSAVKETHFGFKNVSEKDKGIRVHEVFSKVANKYDLMNDVMSAGIHRLWKDNFVRKISPIDGAQLLDVAGGTGDIAFRYLDCVKQGGGLCEVTVLDINQNMLSVGRSRSQQNGHFNDIQWRLGDAEDLPFKDCSFDVYTVAYGIRNMTHISQVLSQAHRVLKRGGMFACLEFSKVHNYALNSLYDLYSFNVIPVMGKLVADDFRSYKYLVESIRKFPDQDKFKAFIEKAGFKNVSYQNLFWGVSAIHTAFKL